MWGDRNFRRRPLPYMIYTGADDNTFLYWHSEDFNKDRFDEYSQTGRETELKLVKNTTVTYSLEEVKKEMVEFNGKQYIKADLEKALELIKPVK